MLSSMESILTHIEQSVNLSVQSDWHRCLIKMTVIFQTTFSIPFSQRIRFRFLIAYWSKVYVWDPIGLILFGILTLYMFIIIVIIIVIVIHYYHHHHYSYYHHHYHYYYHYYCHCYYLFVSFCFCYCFLFIFREQKTTFFFFYHFLMLRFQRC